MQTAIKFSFLFLLSFLSSDLFAIERPDVKEILVKKMQAAKHMLTPPKILHLSSEKTYDGDEALIKEILYTEEGLVEYVGTTSTQGDQKQEHFHYQDGLLSTRKHFKKEKFSQKESTHGGLKLESQTSYFYTDTRLDSSIWESRGRTLKSTYQYDSIGRMTGKESSVSIFEANWDTNTISKKDDLEEGTEWTFLESLDRVLKPTIDYPDPFSDSYFLFPMIQIKEKLGPNQTIETNFQCSNSENETLVCSALRVGSNGDRLAEIHQEFKLINNTYVPLKHSEERYDYWKFKEETELVWSDDGRILGWQGSITYSNPQGTKFSTNLYANWFYENKIKLSRIETGVSKDGAPYEKDSTTYFTYHE